jgi:hypothetical protein
MRLPGFSTVAGKYCAGLVCVLVCALLYLPVNRYPLFAPRELPLTWIDRVIPFWPVTGWIYLGTFAFLVWAFVSTRDHERLTRFLYACTFVQVAAALCFYFYPITFPRYLYPVLGDTAPLNAAVTAFQRGIDAPTNCLPSLHVTTDLLCVVLIGRRRRLAFRLSVPLAIVLSLSILTFKQHYFIDAVAGLALGLLAYIIFFRWSSLRIGGGHARRFA